MDQAYLIWVSLFFFIGAFVMLMVTMTIAVIHKDSYLRYFGVYWIILTLVYFLLYLALALDIEALLLPYSIGLITAGFIFLKTTLVYFNDPMKKDYKYLLITLFIIMFGLLFVDTAPAIDRLTVFGPVAIFFGLSSRYYLKRHDGYTRLYGGVVLTLAIINLLYAFFAEHPLYIPWGYTLTNIVGAFFSVGFIILHFRHIDAKHVAEKAVLTRMSFHDGLTNLYNRNYFNKVIDMLETEKKVPIGLILADLNNLKAANDTYGHDVGDAMIRKTADIIRDKTREKDIVFRYGGDEFLVILPDTNSETTKALAETIKKAIATTKIESLAISLAVGYACKTDGDANINTVFREAETRMYQDKQAH